jgi:hypothetical protein
MTYTPIKTWASGNVLTGTDLNTELIGLKKFTHRIGSGDLKNAKFVDTQHVMPGTIDAQTNVTHNCTGIFGGQQHSSQSLNYTFLTKYNSTRTSANVNNIVIPETSFTIDIGRPASVLFSWWIQEKTIASTLTPGELNYFVGTHSDPITPNGTHKSTGFTAADRINGSGNFVPGINISSTNYLSGFAVLETSAVSFYMGLRGKTYNGQCQVMSWGVSLELFYM